MHAFLHVIYMQNSSLLYKYPSILHFLFTQTKTKKINAMANKLFLVCTSLALCFLLTNASIYRTVVEVDEDDDTNPIGPFGPRQKCRKEFQQAQHLKACQQFIRHQARRQSRGGPSLDDEFDFEDEIDIEENRRGGQGQGQSQSPLLQQCCNELRQEDQVCVCPTLKRAVRAVSVQGGQQQQGHQQHQVRQIFQTAKYLPNVCNIPQVGVCPFRTPSSPYSPY